MREDLPGRALVCGLIAVGLAAVFVVGRGRPVALDEWGRPRDRQPLEGMRLDVNTATSAELTLLPGVGPALAERIVADRAARGPFESVEDLDRVERIGPALVDRVRGHVEVKREESGPVLH